MTTTYAPRTISSLCAEGYTPCSAAALLGMDEEHVATVFAELDAEFDALQRRLNATVTTDAWDVL